jgi:hypothetical protein
MTSLDHSAKAPAPPSGISAGVLMNPVRLVMIARCWIVVAFAAYVVDLLRQTRDGLSNGLGRPFGDDFVNYWSAPFLALHGRVGEVYDFAAFHAFEQSVTAQTIQFYHYSYPPLMLLITLPLALIPYVPALFVWLSVTWFAFYRALKLTGGEDVLLLSIATPALFVSAVGGQNGAMTAALLGGGLMLVDRRPVVAGILLGLMVYKPQLALMLPFALFAGRRWLVIVVTAATAMLLVAMSVAVYGLDAWLHYQSNLALLRTVILEDGAGVSHRMMSVFVFARHLGASVAVSYVLQAVSGLAAAYFVARSWLRNDPAHIRNALVIVGTCLATPYLQDYDLVMGAFVVVWLHMAEKSSQLPAQWIRAAMASILLGPLVNAPVGKFTGIALGPVFIVPVFVLLVYLAADRRYPGGGQLQAVS